MRLLLPPPVLSLGACSALSVGLLVARSVHYGSRAYLFLGFNLLLAWIPYVASHVVASGKGRGWLLWAVLGSWLLFFPNAPYLLTDFVHLRARPPVPLWYDVAMLAAFAWTGMLLALSSLHLIHTLARWRFGRGLGWALAAGASGMAGMGIYIGRDRRWNSWDALLRPGHVLGDVAPRFLQPDVHPKSWGVTAVYGALFFLTYVAWASRPVDQRATVA